MSTTENMYEPEVPLLSLLSEYKGDDWAHDELVDHRGYQKEGVDAHRSYIPHAMREGGREGGKEGRRKGGREGGREGEGGRGEGRERGRRERGREGEGGRGRGRIIAVRGVGREEGRRDVTLLRHSFPIVKTSTLIINHARVLSSSN